MTPSRLGAPGGGREGKGARGRALLRTPGSRGPALPSTAAPRPSAVLRDHPGNRGREGSAPHHSGAAPAPPQPSGRDPAPDTKRGRAQPCLRRLARPPAALWAVTRPPPPLTGQLSHESLRHQRHVAAGGHGPRARTGTGRRAAGAATASGARPAPAGRAGLLPRRAAGAGEPLRVRGCAHRAWRAEERNAERRLGTNKPFSGRR